MNESSDMNDVLKTSIFFFILGEAVGCVHDFVLWLAYIKEPKVFPFTGPLVQTW